jgi:formiminotetrahydrofolate cyclodeaminase
MAADDTADDIDPGITPLAEWLDRLSQAHGAPGGGAACAVMTAISAALLEMVARYSTADAESRPAAKRLASIRHAATRAAEDDGVRSAAFGAALAMDDGAEREQAVRSATTDAVASSLGVARLGAALVPEVRLLAKIENPHVDADLRVAVGALRAALNGVIDTARADLDILAHHRADGDGLDGNVEEFERSLAEAEEALAAV